MNRLRIAQRGWHIDRPAKTLDDVQVGIGVHWIEINGHRIEGVVSAQLVACDDEVSVPHLVLEVLGSAEIVYLGEDDEILGSVETENTPQLKHDRFMDRPT